MAKISTKKLNRKERRIAHKHFKKEVKSAKWTRLEKVELPREHYVQSFIAFYKNDIVSVQEFKTRHGYAYGIRRHDEEPVYSYKTIQAIKNELVGIDQLAYQVYPKQMHEVDEANMTWIFCPNDDYAIFNLKFDLETE